MDRSENLYGYVVGRKRVQPFEIDAAIDRSDVDHFPGVGRSDGRKEFEMRGVVEMDGARVAAPPYENDDLPVILARFGVGLVPYRVGHPMTDHVNPDKLHHYLNAGLAVVASPIPAARRLGRYIHVMATGGDWVDVLSELETARPQEGWPRESNTWDRRWVELVNLVLPEEAAALTPQVERQTGTA